MKHFEVCSWPGFFFTWVWMFISRLWVGAIVIFVIASATPFAAGVASLVLSAGEDGTAATADIERYDMLAGTTTFAVWLVVSLLVGTKGNGWCRRLLTQRGFDHVKSVQAANADAAVSEVSSEHEAAQDRTP